MAWTDDHYGVNKFIHLVDIAAYDVVSWIRGVSGEIRNENYLVRALQTLGYVCGSSWFMEVELSYSDMAITIES
jgi:hypothetical protein